MPKYKSSLFIWICMLTYGQFLFHNMSSCIQGAKNWYRQALKGRDEPTIWTLEDFGISKWDTLWILSHDLHRGLSHNKWSTVKLQEVFHHFGKRGQHDLKVSLRGHLFSPNFHSFVGLYKCYKILLECFLWIFSYHN